MVRTNHAANFGVSTTGPMVKTRQHHRRETETRMSCWCHVEKCHSSTVCFRSNHKKLKCCSTSDVTGSFLRSAVWNGLHAQNVVDRLIRPSIAGWLARTHPTVLRRKLQYPCITDPPTINLICIITYTARRCIRDD